MMARLEGKTAIIIGAGQTPGETIGNGRAMAMLFAREGADVLCVDRDLARADDTVAAIAAEGGTAWSHAADIVRADQVAGIFDAALARWRQIDILVNNVGIGITGAEADGPPHIASEAAFDTTLDVNLKGMWLTIKAAIPIMRARGGGSIVNISSLASVAGDTAIAYMVSKAAVNRLTLAVASSYVARGVRCNAICPGTVKSPSLEQRVAALGGDQDAVWKSFIDRQPMGRLGTPEEIAALAVYLASDESAFTTGAIHVIDGGWTD